MPHHCCPQPMAGGGHRGPAVPLVLGRIVGLGLVECPGSRLTAKDKDLPAQGGSGDAAPRCRHWDTRAPSVGGKVVLFVHRQVSRIASVKTSADGVEPAAYHSDSQVIPRAGDGGAFRPTVLQRIVLLVGTGVSSIRSDPAHGVNLSTDYPYCQGSSCSRHGSPGAPLVQRRIVLVDRIHWPPPRVVAPDHVDFPRHGGCPDVVEGAWKGGPTPPEVLCWIIPLNQISALTEPANHIDPPPDFNHRHLGPRGGHGCPSEPLSPILPEGVQRNANQQSGRKTKRKKTLKSQGAPLHTHL